MNRIAVYVRQSQDKAGNEAAVERQEASCRMLAEAKGWNQVMLYRDNDKSASNGKERPEFERLLHDVEAGRISAIIVWHLDRLTRTIRDLTRVIEAGKSKRVNIACVHGVSLDLGDPTGVAVATILTAIAAMEVQHKGKRQKLANRQRATDGGAFWTRRPFGYDRNDNGVFIVENEAAAIRAAAEAVRAGSTVAAIARAWNAEGLRTTAKPKGSSEGGLWGVTQVRRVLLNPRYSGRRPYQGEDGEELEARGNWEAILDTETQQRLEEHLTDPRRRTAPDDLNVKHLLSGVCICGKCGEKMYASPMKSKGKEWMVYRCFGGYCTTRRLDLVEDVVEARVVGILSRPDAASLFSSDDDANELRAKATDLRRRREDLAAMLADGLLPASAVREQAGKLSSQLQEVEANLAALDTLNPAAAVIAADDVQRAWIEASLGNKRKIIRALMDVTILPAGKGARFSPEHIQTTPKGVHA